MFVTILWYVSFLSCDIAEFKGDVLYIFSDIIVTTDTFSQSGNAAFFTIYIIIFTYFA